MWRLGLTRLAAGIPALLVVTVVVFAVVRLIPGDPARILAGDFATEEVVRELRARWQLDRPLPVQYLAYLEGLARGESLVVQGAHFLRDGNPIRVMADGATAEAAPAAGATGTAQEKK